MNTPTRCHWKKGLRLLSMSALSAAGLGCHAADVAGDDGEFRAGLVPIELPQLVEADGAVPTSQPLEHEVAPLVLTEVDPQQQRISLTNRGSEEILLSSIEVSTSMAAVELQDEPIGPFETIEIEVPMADAGDSIFVRTLGASGVPQDLQYLPFGAVVPTPPDTGLWQGPAVALGASGVIRPAAAQMSWVPASAESYSGEAMPTVLSGTVTEPDGTPIVGANLEVLCEAGSAFGLGAQTTTTLGGSFSLSRPDASLCWARASSPGFVTTSRAFLTHSTGPLRLQLQRLSAEAATRTADDTIQFANGATLTADPEDLDAHPELYLTMVSAGALSTRDLAPAARAFAVEVHGPDPDAHVVFEHAIAQLDTPLPGAFQGLVPEGQTWSYPVGEGDAHTAGAASELAGWIEINHVSARLLVDRFSGKTYQAGADRIRYDTIVEEQDGFVSGGTCLCYTKDSTCNFKGIVLNVKAAAEYSLSNDKALSLAGGFEKTFGAGSKASLAADFKSKVAEHLASKITASGSSCGVVDKHEPPLCTRVERFHKVTYYREAVRREHNAGILKRLGTMYPEVDPLDLRAEDIARAYLKGMAEDWSISAEEILPRTSVTCGESYDQHTDDADQCDCNDAPDANGNFQFDTGGNVMQAESPGCPGLGTVTTITKSKLVDSCEPSSDLYQVLEAKFVAAKKALPRECSEACGASCTGTIESDDPSLTAWCVGQSKHAVASATGRCRCSPRNESQSIDDPLVDPLVDPIPFPGWPSPIDPVPPFEPIPWPGGDPIDEPLVDPLVDPIPWPGGEPIDEPLVDPLVDPIPWPGGDPIDEPLVDPIPSPDGEPVEPVDAPLFDPVPWPGDSAPAPFPYPTPF